MEIIREIEHFVAQPGNAKSIIIDTIIAGELHQGLDIHIPSKAPGAVTPFDQKITFTIVDGSKGVLTVERAYVEAGYGSGCSYAYYYYAEDLAVEKQINVQIVNKKPRWQKYFSYIIEADGYPGDSWLKSVKRINKITYI
jgi:hypothetical protein